MISSSTISFGSFADENTTLNGPLSNELLMPENQKNSFLALAKNKTKFGFDLACNKTKFGYELARNKTKTFAQTTTFKTLKDHFGVASATITGVITTAAAFIKLTRIYTRKLTELDNKYNKLTQEKDALANANQDLTNKNQDLAQKADDLNNQNKGIGTKIIGILKDISNLNNDYSTNSTITLANRLEQEIHQAMFVRDNEIKTQQTENNKLKEENSNLQKKKTELEKDNKDIIAKTVSLETIYNEKCNTIKKLKKDKETLSDEKEQLEKKLKKEKDNPNELSHDKPNPLLDQIINLKAQLKSANEERDQFEKQAQLQSIEEENLKRKIEELKK